MVWHHITQESRIICDSISCGNLTTGLTCVKQTAKLRYKLAYLFNMNIFFKKSMCFVSLCLEFHMLQERTQDAYMFSKANHVVTTRTSVYKLPLIWWQVFAFISSYLYLESPSPNPSRNTTFLTPEQFRKKQQPTTQPSTYLACMEFLHEPFKNLPQKLLDYPIFIFFHSESKSFLFQVHHILQMRFCLNPTFWSLATWQLFSVHIDE